MKVKMLEGFQEVGLKAIIADEGQEASFLEKGETYIVPQLVGEFLIAGGKAEEIKPLYVPKPAPEPEPMADAEAEEPVFKKRGRK